MSIKGVARPGGYIVPRKPRRALFSRQPEGLIAVPVARAVETPEAASDAVREFRGNTRLATDFPGLFAYQLHGARVIR